MLEDDAETSTVEVDDALDAGEQQQSSEQRGSDAGGADAARRHRTGAPAREAEAARPAPRRMTLREEVPWSHVTNLWRVGRGMRRFSGLRVIAQVGSAEWGKARATSITDIGPPSQNTRRGHPPRRYEER